MPHDSKENLQKITEAGFAMRLAKPINLENTIAAIKKLALQADMPL